MIIAGRARPSLGQDRQFRHGRVHYASPAPRRRRYCIETCLKPSASRHLPGIAALLTVTLVWGTTFPAMKDMTGALSASMIVLVRFTLAGLLLTPFLWRARAGDVGQGVLAGVVLFFCYVFQIEGLSLTSSNRNAFLTGLNVLVVPLLGMASGKLPERRIVLALLLALAGLFALCWDGGISWGRGDTLALLAAVCFGLYVKMMEAATRKVQRLMTLTAAQIVTVAVCAAGWLLWRDMPSGAQAGPWQAAACHAVLAYKRNLVYLGVVATAAIISLQTWGQRHSSANEAAVIYAFEPGCAAIFAYFWLGETLAWNGLLGAALLISGMIVSQWSSSRPAAVLAPE
ncbi:DMT family transporter [Duganella sp. FT3S]|uniref:DMT family transporter n=1 Tax=Rugamonas fusca TaxID=2758568 RepID=A0A7W2EJM3_9BURK|nr:DMT family transporter [Rugamonas fusca]